ncbi:MAG: efflux RND transporter permease subunit, partial [Cyanobacteria bacterium P01_C01_bin.38]
KKSIQSPLTESAIIDGKPGIAVAVLMESTTRIDRWREENRQTLAQFQSKLPAGIELQVIFDQSRYVNYRLNHLFQNLILGAVCVVGVTIFLMGWKSALVVGLSLPLSILMVFGGMRLLSIPLHQISVTGLVISLGLLIDNAIVVVDEIQILFKAGYQPKEAISKSVSYLAVPLLASNLTTALTFTPVAMLPGGAGEFLRTMALCVMLALLCSLLLSLTIVPASIGLMFNIHSKGNSYDTFTFSRRWWNIGFSHAALTRVYQNCLDFILLQPVLGILLALILPITGFLMAGNIPEQFFPAAERDQFHIELELTASASLKETESAALKARKIILSHPEIVNVHWFFGRNVPSFYYNIEQSRKNLPYYAQALVQLDSAQNSRQQIRILQEELDRALPSARVLVRQLEQGPGVAAPIELSIYGPDLDILEKLGQEARSRLAEITDVTHTNISLGEALPKLGLNVDAELTKLTGLNNTEIAQQLNANLEGILGGSILEGSEELPVRVRLSNRTRGNLNQIASLQILPTTINNNEIPTIPLSTIAKIQLVPELAKITRHNGKRVNVVQGFITAGILPAKVLNDFKQNLQKSDFQLPIGYKMEFGGESAKRDEAIGQLLSNLGVLLVLMFAVLVLSFASFKSAIIIAIVGICSIGLGLYSLWIFGYPLGFMAVLGTIGLTGVAINDSIVILAALKA